MNRIEHHDGYKVSYTDAKTILNLMSGNDTWLGLKYTMNLYRGCQHRCIYCDSRSECYRIADFAKEIIVKQNALTLLEKEIAKLKVIGTIGFGSMNDCYMPIEKELKMARQALEIILKWQLPVHIITKSNLVLRDIDLLSELQKIYAAVSFTILTTDDHLSLKIEPGAPIVSERFQAMSILASAGILTGITLMPVLPYITDSPENILDVVKKAKDCGAQYFIPAFGVTLRDRQREYYYNQLDTEFPGLSEKYRMKYKNYYSCSVPGYQKISDLFYNACAKAGVPTKIPLFKPDNFGQLKLF